MPQKMVITLTCEKDEDARNLRETLNSLERTGAVSTVVIPPLSLPQIFARNFMIGIARGLGFFIGGTVIIGLIVWAIQTMISMNIPYLTELLKELLTMIKAA